MRCYAAPRAHTLWTQGADLASFKETCFRCWNLRAGDLDATIAFDHNILGAAAVRRQIMRSLLGTGLGPVVEAGSGQEGQDRPIS